MIQLATLFAAHPWAAVALLTAAFGALAVAAVFLCRGKVAGVPCYSIHGVPEAVTMRMPSRKEPGEVVRSLTLTRVWLWNGGREPMRPGEASSEGRLGLQLREGVQLWSWRIALANNLANKFHFGEPALGFVPISFEYAGRGEGVCVELLHSGRSAGDVSFIGNAQCQPAEPSLRCVKAGSVSQPFEVAPVPRRAIAAAIDASLIALIFVAVVAAQQIAAGRPPVTNGMLALYVAIPALLAIAYGAVFSILGLDTVGTCLAHLRLVGFDGTPAGGRDRAMRLCGKCFGLAGLGFGLAWVLIDKQHLTWHDRLSRTFPSAGVR